MRRKGPTPNLVKDVKERGFHISEFLVEETSLCKSVVPYRRNWKRKISLSLSLSLSHIHI